MKEINLFLIILINCIVNSLKVKRINNFYINDNQDMHMTNDTFLVRYDIVPTYENFTKDYETINFERPNRINYKSNLPVSNIVCKYPFNLQTCKDEIHIMAESLVDTTLTKDFINKENAYFTINLSNVNKFHTKDISNLLESIKLSELSVFPSILPGSVNCIGVESNKNILISICLKNEEEIQSLLTAFDYYFTCNIINIKSQQIKKSKTNIVTLNKSIADIENKFITEHDEKSVYNIKIKSIFDKETR